MILRALLALLACLLALVAPVSAHTPISHPTFVPPPVALFGVKFDNEQDGGPLTLHLDGLHDRAGPGSGVLVRQNPWSGFDPEGLESSRVDPDGFKWSDRDHHTVPRAVARDAGWCPEAKSVFDKAKLPTPEGHNFQSHSHYNKEVGAEMAEFVSERAPKGLSQMSAKDQSKLAEEFVDRIASTENKFIRGFNASVKGGPGAVAAWFDSKGGKMILKSTGKAAVEGGIVVTGITRTLSIGGKILKGLPIVAGVAVVGIDIAQGKDSATVGQNLLLSLTQLDTIKMGADAVENKLDDVVYPKGEKNKDGWQNLNRRFMEENP